jgi:MFS family permease
LSHKTAAPVPGKPSSFYSWYIVAASWFLGFSYSGMAVNVFFKPMLEEFGWDRATLSLVQSVSMIFMLVASPFLGRIVDRFGPRAMLLVSEIVQGLSGLINAGASTIWHLFIARILFGLNAVPGTQVLINHWFVKKRGLALGIISTGLPAGTVLLVPLSQFLILQWGWRPTMLFWAVIVLITGIPLVLTMKNSPRDKGMGPDGQLLESAGAINAPAPGHALSSSVPPAKHGSGIAEAMKTSSFWFLAITQVICGLGCGFMMTHNIIFATDMGFSDMAAASLVSVQGGVNLVGVLVVGYISDRIARKNALALTHFIRSLAFAVIALFVLLGGGGGQPWMLFLGVALFGFGWFTTAPLTAALVADLFGSLRMGTIMGIAMAAHGLGNAIGSYAGGVIFESTGSYLLFLLLQGPLELVAAAFAFYIKRRALYRQKSS